MHKMMHAKPKTEHAMVQPEARFNWDDVRIFLLVAQTGSFRSAAIQLDQSLNAVRNRIASLEDQIGEILFQRSASGVRLTETGERLIEVAEELQSKARLFAQMTRVKAQSLMQTVRIGITEGLGAFWLIPMFGRLQTSSPDIQFEIACSMTPPDLTGHAADIAIQLDKPTDPNLIVKRLGHLHVVLFASRNYITQHGAPACRADVGKHPFIEIAAPQIPSTKLGREVTNENHRRFVALRVNASSPQFIAAVCGWGVTALPNYAPAIADTLVHVAPDFHLRRDIWLAYHPQAANLPHIRRTIDWVSEAFDPVKYPWFRENLMSPAEIFAYNKAKSVRSFFTYPSDIATAS